ncbi:MAG: alpha/beta hydrolase [Pseudomonadota bacterium]
MSEEPRDARLLGLSASGFHRLHVSEWGRPDAARNAVCVHGLTRNGRDFDWLARALVGAGYRVACPDVVGRGKSAWLADPAGYGYPLYLADSAVLLAHLGVESVDWIGTSMGGLIGMMLAAQPGSPIRRLVVNDVGPFIPAAALKRIGDYVGTDPHFADMAAAEAYFREVAAPFGDLTDSQWRHMAEHSTVPAGNGGYRLAYDPAIALPFRVPEIGDVALWEVWDKIDCPVLVLRGAESDLLLPETAEEMTRRGPKARVVEVSGCGHAPALMADDQIATLLDWLAETG